MSKSRTSQPVATIASALLEAFEKEGKSIGAVKKGFKNSINKDKLAATRVSPPVKSKKTNNSQSQNKKKQVSIGKKTVFNKKQKPSKSVNNHQQRASKVLNQKNKSNANKKRSFEHLRTKPENLDLSCYGNSKSVNDTSIKSDVQIPKKEIELKSPLEPNYSSFPEKIHPVRLKPNYLGNEIELEGEKNDVCDIVIGLDFGTSNVKVVLNDPQRQKFYAVPFFPTTEKSVYIFPSKVYLRDGKYSLENIGRLYTNLKLPLLGEGKIKDEDTLRAIVFLALIIRHVRGWFFSFHDKTYQNSSIEWSLNLGLATEHNEDSVLKKRFREIALASMNLAGDSDLHLTDKLSDHYYQMSKEVLVDPKTDKLIIHPDMVNVYPEIGAQVVGFVESESWNAKDHPFITMVDIGAGTVDISFFSVQKERSKRTFIFFQNSVEQNGIRNLHLQRIEWLKVQLNKCRSLSTTIKQFLDAISNTDTYHNIIPESVSDYLINLKVTKKNIDSNFFAQFNDQVFKLLREVKKKRVPRNDSNWINLPIFICGGGSRMLFYSQIIDRLNNKTNHSWLHVNKQVLSKPKNLIAGGLRSEEYDRLSVAYGLSFVDLGKIISSGSIDDFYYKPRLRKNIDQTDDG